jgi:chaperonin GroEL
MREKKDRVDDALQATKAALEEGIVPGGGAALIYAREAITDRANIGKNIVYKACSSPFMKILTNAGKTDAECYGLINGITQIKTHHTASSITATNDNWIGYDLKTDSFVNMKIAGIIDPAKVTRTAIENAASVAGTILLTEAVVVDKPEEKKSEGGYGDMMGMM